MGMAASQARLLNLQARQSNLEYQGQQINQERTILSQQCTALYNSLLAMEVPTPPSTQDFTKIQYTGVNGATNFTLGNITPNGTKYNVEMKYVKTGDAIDENYTKYAVYTSPKEIYVNKNVPVFTKVSQASANEETFPDGASPANVLRKIASPTQDQDVYILTENGFSKTKYNAATMQSVECYELKDASAEGFKVTKDDYFVKSSTKDDNKKYYCKEATGTWRVATKDDFEADGSFKASLEYAVTGNEKDGTKIDNPEYVADAKTVGGNSCYTFEDLRTKPAIKGKLSEAEIQRYEGAIKNMGFNPDEFYVFFDSSDNDNVQFVRQSVVNDNLLNQTGTKYAQTYSYTANGTYNETKPIEGATLEFDTEGRITQIGIPTEDGNGVQFIDMSAETITDDAAYKDAYNQYEYAQYEYDKKQQEINAKTSIIQQEDRNLELKLQRLDNERTQIKTEIDAVDKVISENIEKSYKTFSG